MIFVGPELNVSAARASEEAVGHNPQKLFAAGVLIKDKPSSSRKAQAKRTEVRKGRDTIPFQNELPELRKIIAESDLEIFANIIPYFFI
jgi:hypothetical protein